MGGKRQLIVTQINKAKQRKTLQKFLNIFCVALVRIITAERPRVLAASSSSFELVPGQSEAPPGLSKLLLLRLLGLFRLLCLLRFLSHSILF